MKTNDELEQQLWDFVFGLLSEEEAEQLTARITSDPAVARAFAKTQLQSALIADAARLQQPPIEWQTPTPEQLAEVSFADGDPATIPFAGGADRQRGAWLKVVVSTAALLLVGFLGYGLVSLQAPREPLASREQPARSLMETDQIRAVLTTPAVFHSDVQNLVQIQATNNQGQPVATNVEFWLYNRSGEVSLKRQAATNHEGVSEIRFTGEELANVDRLSAVVAGASPASSPAAPVHLVAEQYRTMLVTDKPVYRPGETVRYRSVTLSRFDHRADREFEVDFAAQDASGNLVEATQKTALTERGVSAGEFRLPQDAVGGQYSLAVTCDAPSFDSQQRGFLVRDYVLPHWEKKIVLHKESYAPGEKVEAEFQAEEPDGTPAEGVKLRYQAYANGRPVTLENEEAQTDNRGSHQLGFYLPQAMPSDDAMLTVTVQEADKEESFAKRIPVFTGKVIANFFPEGGDLVAGVRQRVYFQTLDPVGEPVHVSGQILDERDQALADIETTHEGRGVFYLQADAGRQYRLRLSPPRQEQSFSLPLAVERNVVMETEAGVFNAAERAGVVVTGEILRVELRARQPQGPLVLAAYCRGALVGLQRAEAEVFEQDGDVFHARMPLNVSPDAAGVIRLTLYDYRDTPPTPIAERLVFCRPARKLQIELSELSAQLAPGEEVDVNLQTRTEHGFPVSAALGVSVVAEHALGMVEKTTPSLPTYFYFASEITGDISLAKELEDASFYVQENASAETAIDLLLGTQGWRRFPAQPWSLLADFGNRRSSDGFELDQLAAQDRDTSTGVSEPLGETVTADPISAGAGLSDSSSLPRSNDPGEALVAWRETALPPQVVDAKISLVSSIAPAKTRTARPVAESTQWIPLVALAAGIVLLILALTLVAKRYSAGPRFWLPAMVVGLAGVGLGVVWQTKPAIELASAPTSGSVADEAGASAGAAEMRLADSEEGSLAPALEEMEMMDDAASDSLVTKSIDPNSSESPESKNEAFFDPPAVPAVNAPSDDAQFGDAAERADRPEEGRQERMLRESAGAPAPSKATEPADTESESAPLNSLLELRQSGAIGGEQTNRERRALPLLPAEGQPRGPLQLGRSRGASQSLEIADLKEANVVVRQGVRYSYRQDVSPDNDTWYWNPLIITDADGRASVRFKTPDQASVSRLRVDAHEQGRLGSTDLQIQVGN